MSRVKQLLNKLKLINDNDDSNEQIIHNSVDNDGYINAMDGTRKKLSPMLLERFNYASKWEDAFLLQTWLSLHEINNYQNIRELVENVNLRIENWDYVPPASVGLSKVSIFGFDPLDTNETYLEWIDKTEEPRVWVFVDGDYHMFTNFEKFLMYTVGESKKDDL